MEDIDNKNGLRNKKFKGFKVCKVGGAEGLPSRF